jgi:ABC-2 type transport system permease protein
MFGYLRLEALRIFRDGGYLFMTLISPLVMYLVFTNLNVTGQGHHDGAIYTMVGMAGFGAVGAALTNGVGIAEDKSVGWIRQLRLLPLAPLQVVMARTLCAMVVALPPILAVSLAGGLVNGVSLGVGQWAAIVGLLWLGIGPIAVLGLGIGYLFDPQKAQAAAAVGYMGLSLIGGLWFPISAFPHWLASISPLTPVNRYGELGWRIADGASPSMTGVAILTGWFAAFAAFAVYAYRRSARTA